MNELYKKKYYKAWNMMVILTKMKTLEIIHSQKMICRKIKSLSLKFTEELKEIHFSLIIYKMNLNISQKEWKMVSMMSVKESLNLQ